jgi:hypothetical protein
MMAYHSLRIVILVYLFDPGMHQIDHPSLPVITRIKFRDKATMCNVPNAC